ncbi:MAG: MurR/RpiR family transcriptional regulator [Gemmobacter sp.]
MPATPPETLDALRRLAIAIGRGEDGPRLGPRARRTLGELIELQGDPAVLSITALAARLGVNPSTLTRLARSLGYPGFPGLQKALLSAGLSAPGDFYSRQAGAALGGAGSLRERAERLCHENQANIARFAEQLGDGAFQRAATRLARARRVAVHGQRQFHAFAAFLAYGLQMVRPDVTLLGASGGGAGDELAALHPGDVLVVASCAPYTPAVVRLATAAHDSGIAVIAVTDLTSSPLVPAAGAVILVPHATSHISNSITAYMACAECLVSATATLRAEDAAGALRRRDRITALLGKAGD